MKKAIILFLVIYSSCLNAQGTWIQKANLHGFGRQQAVGFSIGNKGYVGLGIDVTIYPKQDFWEYDPSTDTWTQKANFPFVRTGAVGFSIGAKGYVGVGDGVGGVQKDFWEYNPSTNLWKQKTSLTGVPREFAVGFSIGNKGYIGLGMDDHSNYLNDFWEYDTLGNNWVQKNNFQGAGRFEAVGFSIGAKGYVGTGKGISNSLSDFWEYDTITDSWNQKADYSGGPRSGSVGFSIGNRGYIGTGDNGITTVLDFWEYNPVTNRWIQKANAGKVTRLEGIGFSIGNKGYLGTGYDLIIGNDYTDFYEYTADTLTSTGDLKTSSSYLHMYPNPFSTDAVIKFENNSAQLFQCALINAAGEQVELLTTNNNEFAITSKNKAPGTYFYLISSDNAKYYGKFIICKKEN